MFLNVMQMLKDMLMANSICIAIKRLHFTDSATKKRICSPEGREAEDCKLADPVYYV